MKNFMYTVALLGAVLTASQLVAMQKQKSGSTTTTELQKFFEQRKKLQEKKWKIERKLNNVGWELWWLDLQSKPKIWRAHFRAYRWYYGSRVVGLLVAAGLAAFVYRTYYSGDESNEAQENNDATDDLQMQEDIA